MRQSSRTPRTRAKRQQLSAFIQAKRATDDRNARRCSSLGQGARAPLASHFSPERHNLTEEECREANQLLRKAERERPLRGDSRQVRFRHGNLLASPFVPGRDRFDIIFCRNLLIYFDQTAQQRAIQALERHLMPGGHLFISHSESLNAVTHTVRWVAPGVYQSPS